MHVYEETNAVLIRVMPMIFAGRLMDAQPEKRPTVERKRYTSSPQMRQQFDVADLPPPCASILPMNLTALWPGGLT